MENFWLKQRASYFNPAAPPLPVARWHRAGCFTHLAELQPLIHFQGLLVLKGLLFVMFFVFSQKRYPYFKF